MMEPKIGEIFKYNEEWYQCIKDDYLQECISCAFHNRGYFSCEEGSFECRDYKRNDNTNVIFQKLEKIGEPYMVHGRLVQKYRFFHNPAIQYNKLSMVERTSNACKIVELIK